MRKCVSEQIRDTKEAPVRSSFFGFTCSCVQESKSSDSLHSLLAVEEIAACRPQKAIFEQELREKREIEQDGGPQENRKEIIETASVILEYVIFPFSLLSQQFVPKSDHVVGSSASENDENSSDVLNLGFEREKIVAKRSGKVAEVPLEVPSHRKLKHTREDKLPSLSVPHYSPSVQNHTQDDTPPEDHIPEDHIPAQ